MLSQALPHQAWCLPLLGEFTRPRASPIIDFFILTGAMLLDRHSSIQHAFQLTACQKSPGPHIDEFDAKPQQIIALREQLHMRGEPRIA